MTDLLLDARVMLPAAKLYLGWYAPYGVYREALDELAVRAGLNVIVNPTAPRARCPRSGARDYLGRRVLRPCHRS